MNICDEFKIAVISDIHFGNGRVSAVRTYEHLSETLYPIMDKIRLLVINGDLFDTLLNMNSDAGFYVAMFIDDIINLAVEHKVYIRVVRGTFSHDRHQNRFFVVKDQGEHVYQDKPLVRVLDKIGIEHFDELNINVLYCPDDQPHENMNDAIIDVIKANHLGSVDLLFSHGYYEHLLPKGIPHIPHNTLSFNKLSKYVTGLMINGHVHKPSVFENKVITCGSFERFEHDNEQPVGMWLLLAKRSKTQLTWKYQFVKNKGAIPFKTFPVDCYKSPEELQSVVTNYIADIEHTGYPTTDPIYIRFNGSVSGMLEWVKTNFKNVVVSEKKTTSSQDIFEEDVSSTSDELPVITEDNLANMVYNNIPKEANMTLDEVKEILNEL